MVEAAESLQMPRPIKGRKETKVPGMLEPAKISPYKRNLEDIKSLREFLGLSHGQSSSGLEFSSDGCGSDLRRLNEFMASEHISLPGSSNVVAVKYEGTPSDIRRAHLAREQNSRDTADAMELGGHTDMDTSAWADQYQSGAKLPNRGHHGPVGCRGTKHEEHPVILEVRNAAQQQKNEEAEEWIKDRGCLTNLEHRGTVTS